MVAPTGRDDRGYLVLSGTDDMTTEMASDFDQLGLSPEVREAVESVGYETPTPIQARSIPPLLEGRDLLGQAQTGTGKTAAFALPLLSRLDLSEAVPQILVLTPTRELALQVAEAMQTYARKLRGFHVLPIYGGQSMSAQLRQLRRGVHAVVGTPGRIQDHLRRQTLDLSRLAVVVIDEADEMLRMGFVDDVDEILEHTPEKRQVALFSATMPPAIRKIARRHLNDPVEIKIETKTATVGTLKQLYWRVSGIHKLDALTRILEAEEFEAMLVFVRTKISTAELSEKLEARGFASAPLNGDMNQALRERTIDRLKKGRLDIVVATDVAARGLDVERISHVINYDIPYDVEAYVHRVGRTGRAGREGTAILFVAPRERRMLRAIEHATRQTIEPMRLPSAADVSMRRVAQFKEQISEAIASEDLGFFSEVLAGYERETEADPKTVAAAVAFLAQRERPLFPRFKEEPIREERERREPGPRRPRPPAKAPDEGLERYRIEVGHDHGVQPGNIVGAIANEAGLDSRHIGHIRIYDTFSTVDLPEGMPRALSKLLQRVWVCDRQLRISLDESPRHRGAGHRGPKGPRKKPGQR